MQGVDNKIKIGKYRWLPWAIAFVWPVFALAGALFHGYVALGRFDPIYTAVICGGFGLAGWVAGLSLIAFVERTRSLTAGALLGHVALAPAALQLGFLGAGAAAAAVVPKLESALAAPVFLAVYAFALFISAATILVAGTAFGMGLQVALRPVLRPVAMRLAHRAPSRGFVARMVVLLAFLAAAVFYADSIGRLPWPEANVPERSAWLDREKTLFDSVLARQRYDIVVLPVRSDGPSFDRIERSLMTRYLSGRVAQRTASRLPDPTLLARALGVRVRASTLDEAQRLASKTGARTLIVTTLRRKGPTFSVHATRWADEGGTWREARSASIEEIRNEGPVIPSAAFRDHADALLDKLGLPKPELAPAPAAEHETLQSWNDLSTLAHAEAPSPLDRALHLQVFAALHTRDSIEAQTLWERSLLALQPAYDASPLARIVEARAYLHLGRRPYALARLGEVDSSAARALRAALNGDVPGAEVATSQIEDPALRLVAEIELVDLYEAYGLGSRIEARRAELIARGWLDAELTRLRFAMNDWFNPEIHSLVAVRLGYADTGPQYVRRLAIAWMRWLYWFQDAPQTDGLRMASAIERSYRGLWMARAKDGLIRSESGERLSELDYYELLYALNRAAALKTVQSTLLMQGLPQVADQMIKTLYPVYRGHPHLTYLHSRALLDLGNRSVLGHHPRLFSASSALALATYRWEAGETRLAQWAEALIYERPYRPFSAHFSEGLGPETVRDRLEYERLSFTRAELDRKIVDARRRLEYSDRDPSALDELVRTLRRAGRGDEADQTIAQNMHRFVGSPVRTSILAETLHHSGERDGIVTLYRDALRLDPESWAARWKLSEAHVENRQFHEAEELFLAYPGFTRREPTEMVTLANRAAEAGRYLYRQGERHHAASLLRLSTSFRTGAGMEMHSHELLAAMDDNLSVAAQHARAMVERYGDSAAAARYLIYTSLLGQETRAWEEFRTLHNRFGDEEPWLFAFVAHRMQGLDEQGIEQWVVDSKSIDTRRDYLSSALRERHAFMLLFLDRAPADAAVKAMQRISDSLNRSPYYPALAAGYVALRRGQYAQAVPGLKGIHDDLENISMNRKTSYNDVLPYLALAYAASGQEAAATQVLDTHLANVGEDADVLIGRALVDGVAGRHDAALRALRLAFHRLPPIRTRSLYPGYVLLEACEMLLQRSGLEVYRELIEDFAPRLQVVLPFSWAAAFEAKYARLPDARQLALSAAAILDPRSERISQFSNVERNAVRGAERRHGSLLGSARRKPTS